MFKKIQWSVQELCYLKIFHAFIRNELQLKHLGHMNRVERVTFLSCFPGLIHWTLHFCVLVAWTERWSLAYLTWKAVPRYSKYIHVPWTVNVISDLSYWRDSAPTPLVSTWTLHSKRFLFDSIRLFQAPRIQPLNNLIRLSDLLFQVPTSGVSAQKPACTPSELAGKPWPRRTSSTRSTRW